MRRAFSLYASVTFAISFQLVGGAALTSYTNSSTSTTSTSSSNVASSPDIGAYIAQGLGLSSSEATSSQLSTNTLGPSLTSSNGSQPATITSKPGLITTGNQTNFTGDAVVCQNSWNTYWSLLADYQTRGVTAITSSTIIEAYTASFGSISTISASPTDTRYITTTLYTLNSAQESSAADLGYVPWIWEWSSELSNTKTTIAPITEYRETIFPITGTTTLYDVTYSSEPAGISPTPPPCSAPIDADACMSSWSTWSSKVGSCYSWQTCGGGDPYSTTASLPTPNCYQVPVNASYCSTLRSLYLAPALGGFFDVSTAPTEILAPGCTLGCGRCTLTAQTFQILYWPTQAMNNSRPATAPATAVVDGSITLTSPQVYLSFKDVGATDYCTVLPETIRSGIVAINSDALTGYGQVDLPSSMGINPTAINHYLYATALPWSQFLSYQVNNISTFHLSIPKEVETLKAGWGSCVPQGFGVAEPPSALTPTMVITPVGPTITSTAVPALAITSTVASTTQTTPLAQTPIPGPSESSESAASRTPVNSADTISSPGAQDTPQASSNVPAPTPQPTEIDESAAPQAPASTAAPTPFTDNASPHIAAGTLASTPQPGETDESTKVIVSPTAALISTSGVQETAPPSPSGSDESLLPLVSIITAALGPSNGPAFMQTSVQPPHTSSSSVPIAFSAITEQSETGGLQGLQPMQTTQAQGSDARAGNSNDLGGSVTSSLGTAVVVQPLPTTSPVSEAVGFGAPNTDNGDNAGNTGSNSAATAVPIFVAPASSSMASGSSDASITGTGDLGSNDGNTPGSQNGSPTAEILLTIGSTVFTAKQTVEPTSDSLRESSSGPASLASVATSFSGAASSAIAPTASPVIVIGSSTLTAGGSALVIQGQVVSYGSVSAGTQGSPGGLGLVVGAATTIMNLPSTSSRAQGGLSGLTASPTALPVIVYGSSTLTAGESAVVIQGQTVSYGSLSPGGLGLVIGTLTTIMNLASSSSGPVSENAIASGASTNELASTASGQGSGTTITPGSSSGASTAATSDGNVLVAKYWKWIIASAAVSGLVS